MNVSPTTSQVKSAKYGRMAPIYNLVTSLVAMGGNGRAQRQFLPFIRRDSRVLTVGCGPNSFNEVLARASDHVTFLDIAPEMLAITEKRVRKNVGNAQHRFVCADIMEFQPEAPYDIVLANFFLNTFGWEDCQKVLARLAQLVGPDGLLCIADEVESQKPVGVAMQSLPRTVVFWLHHMLTEQPLHPIYDYEPVLARLGFEVHARTRLEGDILMSTVYRRKKGSTPA